MVPRTGIRYGGYRVALVEQEFVGAAAGSIASVSKGMAAIEHTRVGAATVATNASGFN
jgi:hypothetical protein